MRPGIDYCGMFPCCRLGSSQFCPYSDREKQSELPKKGFTTEEAIWVGTRIGVDFEKYGVEQFRMGMDVELEHGRRDRQTNTTDDDPVVTGKIALAHLKEFPDYYFRLSKMEKEAEHYWEKESEED